MQGLPATATLTSYKVLAREEEWLRGDRQRSIARKNK
jgi:hypothetical protein